MEITGEMIAGWRAERAASRTSAVGEYAPEEFWALLDEFEKLSKKLESERRRSGKWRELANDAADVLSAFAVGHATQKAIERADAEEGNATPHNNSKRYGPEAHQGAANDGIVIHRVETVVHEHLARRVDVAATASSIMQELHREHVLMFREGCAGWVRDLIAKWRGKTPDTAEQACGIARALVRSADGKAHVPPDRPPIPFHSIGPEMTVGEMRRLLDDPLIQDGWPITVHAAHGGEENDVSIAVLRRELHRGERLCLSGTRLTFTEDAESMDWALWRAEKWEG